MKDRFWRVMVQVCHNDRPKPLYEIYDFFYFHDQASAVAFIQDWRKDGGKAFIQGDVCLSKNDQIRLSLE